MIKHRCIPLSSEVEWKEALTGIRHSIFHTWEYCFAMNMTTGYNTYLYCYENGDIKILSPISEREYRNYKDICTPYGFSGFTGNGNCASFQYDWKEFTKEKKYVSGYISLNPLFINKTYFNAEDSSSTASLYFINLSLSLTELFDNLNSNRKRQIKNYRKFEASFTYDKKEIINFFTENYFDFLKRINASPANYFSSETLRYICSMDNIFMVGYKYNGKTESVYIFGYTDYTVDCLFNVSTAEGRQYSPYLLWCGIKYFRLKKIPVMNLGGGSITGDSIDESKQRFGAYGLPFVNLKQIYDLNIYDKLCKDKGVDLENSGYFPAYRKN